MIRLALFFLSLSVSLTLLSAAEGANKAVQKSAVDLNSRSRLGPQLSSDRIDGTPEQWEVARAMESVLVDQMIQEMRKSVPDSDIVPKSNAEKIYQQMLDNEYAKAMSQYNTIGIAGLIVEQMQGRR